MERQSVKSQDAAVALDQTGPSRNTPPPGLPQVPRTLSGVEESAWQLLRRGTKDRRSAFHTLTLATVASEGLPEMRVVVLREVDRERRLLRFNTDLRTPKFAELTANPRVAIQGYDPRRKVALRLAGIARTEAGTERVQAVWDGMKDMSRECYRVGQSPSTPIPSPEESPLHGLSEEEAFANFALVDVVLTRLEWLYLRHGGHMRARVTWPDDAAPGSAPDATWLVA
ncbi:MAG: pyridoxamine 5'-phosphate oxidase family protein [Pseudomonadota bacterium]